MKIYRIMIVVLAISSFSMGLQAKTAVSVSSIESADSHTVIQASGLVVSRHEVNVSSEIEGRLLSVKEAGSFVKEGEVLSEIDDSEFVLQLKHQELQIEKLKKHLQFQSSKLERITKLEAKNGIAKQDLESIQSQYHGTDYDLALAKVQAELIGLKIERSKIKAPFNGQVVVRSLSKGAYVTAGKNIVTFVDIDAKEVSAKVDINDVDNIKKGDIVSVWHDVNNAINAKVHSVILAGDEESHMAEVIIRGDKLGLNVGTSVKLSIKANPESSLITWKVPRDALVLRKESIYVYQLDDASNAAQIKVILHSELDSEFVRVSGQLDESKSIVVRGAEMLKNGQAVKVL